MNYTSFLNQYNNARLSAKHALDSQKNIVLLGDKGKNGKSYLINDLNPTGYKSLYGVEENSKHILFDNNFILETNTISDLEKLNEFRIEYTLIKMPLSYP